MPVAPTQYKDLRNKQTELIRKALDGSVFLDNITGTAITSITDSTGALTTLPVGWDDLGWLSNDGAAFARDVSSSDVTSWGSTSPTRSDVITDSSTLTVVCHETKMLTIGLATGADLAGVVPKMGGEVVIRKPARPSSRHYRVLSLAEDQGDGGPIYIGRFMPRAKVTAYNPQNLGGGDEPITWGVTLTAYEDSVLGFSESWHFGGPGWLALLDAMGFPPAALV